ncbi:hypothetical protein RclHR1_03050001 [Rhizophagus clarus]|uniref:B30.2/SPRY domain-containing protein n=1 Tax=Rhizophagus clarus TaxID=94130 RepID=A0A2Z6R9L1_9GLOM|nr:hypothetical protein RclHR1_03050001 [Rhizophagus clarus]
MEIILEYIYTGSVKEEFLTEVNIIEAFFAADYFQLQDLQDIIIRIVKNTLEKNCTRNYSPELLSKASEKSLTNDNILSNLLAKEVASISLNDIKFGRLSIAGFKYLLSFTHEKDIPFATSEYEVFRYSAILAAKQVSNDAYETLKELLPSLEQIESSIKLENELIDLQKVIKELEPYVKFIDFNQIKAQILADIIEPLKIIPHEIIVNVYRRKALSNNSDLNNIRVIPICKIKETDLFWDESALVLENTGIFEWDIILEKVHNTVWVGVCASENFDCEKYAGDQDTVVWAITTDGYYRHKNYCPKFGDGKKITVHLDMIKRACTFTINGKKYPETLEHDNLPKKHHPVVLISGPSRIRIQAHQKN